MKKKISLILLVIKTCKNVKLLKIVHKHIKISLFIKTLSFICLNKKTNKCKKKHQI